MAGDKYYFGQPAYVIETPARAAMGIKPHSGNLGQNIVFYVIAGFVILPIEY
jgi:hypothetical protein